LRIRPYKRIGNQSLTRKIDKNNFGTVGKIVRFLFRRAREKGIIGPEQRESDLPKSTCDAVFVSCYPDLLSLAYSGQQPHRPNEIQYTTICRRIEENKVPEWRGSAAT